MPEIIGRDTPDPQTTPTTPPGMERTAELMAFMMSVRRISSGSHKGTYTVVGGAYGIDATRWSTLARQAGLDGANFRDPAMQDYVAAWTMKRMFEKYGNWNLVALAWEQGEGAANAVIKQTNKAPVSVTIDDISNFTETSFVSQVSSDMVKAGIKGLTEETITLSAAANTPQPTTVITGTGRVSMEDTYNATVRQLWQEAEAEREQGLPSATNVLFDQLNAWSESIAGGSRLDYRTDASSVESGDAMVDTTGGVNELDPMKVEQR